MSSSLLSRGPPLRTLHQLLVSPLLNKVEGRPHPGHHRCRRHVPSVVCRMASASSVASPNSLDLATDVHGGNRHHGGRMMGREFEVPVPWGKVAGKEWGDPNGYPWITIHGWLDNCGTFDTLAPKFPAGHRLICLDMPGHGFSSHVPDGFCYHYLESLHLIRRLSKHFKLAKFGLLGHSMGGGIALLFAATHPDMASHVITLDIVKPISRKHESLVRKTRSSVDDLLKFEDKVASKPAPVYTYEEAKMRLIQAGNMIHGMDNITDVEADILLKRGLTKSSCGEGYIFSRDLKHRIGSLYSFTQDMIRHFAAAIVCPLLIIKAENGPFYEDKGLAEEVLEVYRENNPDFTFAEVEGQHHVHLSHPDRVLKPIDEFLDKHKSDFFKDDSKI